VAGSILADSARKKRGEGLGKIEGVVRNVLMEGIEEGPPEMSVMDRRRELGSALSWTRKKAEEESRHTVRTKPPDKGTNLSGFIVRWPRPDFDDSSMVKNGLFPRKKERAHAREGSRSIS